MTKQSEYFKKILCKDELPEKDGVYETDIKKCKYFLKYANAKGGMWCESYEIREPQHFPDYFYQPIPSQPVLSFEEFKKEYGTVEFTNVVNFAKEIVIVGDDVLKMKYKWYLLGCNQSLPASQPSITFEDFEKECKKLGLTCISENGQIDKYTSVKIKEFYDKIIGCNQPPVEPFDRDKALEIIEDYVIGYVNAEGLLDKLMPIIQSKPVEGDIREDAIKIISDKMREIVEKASFLNSNISIEPLIDALLSKYNFTKK